MIESVDFSVRSNSETSVYDGKKLYAFVIVSCCYMLPWTAIGSLLHYFSGKYGDGYFVYLNVAFYGVGLPLNYTQRKFDAYLDLKFGSLFTFSQRLYVCLTALIISLISAPFLGEYSIIVLVCLIGIFTWTCHGCVSSLSSLVKMNSSTFQQIGFALPGLYSIIMMTLLDMQGNDLPNETIYIYYYVTAICVVPGIIAWYVLLKSNVVVKLLKGNLSTYVSIYLIYLILYLIFVKLLSVKDFNAGLSKHDASLEKSFGSNSIQHTTSLLRGTISQTDNYDDKGCVDVYTADTNMKTNDKEQYQPITYEDDKDAHIVTKSEISHKINLHRWSLFLNISISIFQGSFMSYTCGCTLWGLSLPPLLYFIRYLSI
jgi:hypothetical protein